MQRRLSCDAARRDVTASLCHTAWRYVTTLCCDVGL